MKISDIEINVVANPLAHRVTARITAGNAVHVIVFVRIDPEGFVHVPDQIGLGAEVDSDLLDNNLICKV
jgi:L-alanine-DL-glutamate epimerase-like enolase superfamily enzyme